jgi:hypothetical protein
MATSFDSALQTGMAGRDASFFLSTQTKFPSAQRSPRWKPSWINGATRKLVSITGWPSSISSIRTTRQRMGQLRNMLESLIKSLAMDHAGYVDTGKANQGGQAIKHLYVQGAQPPATIGDPLPERDGGGMLQGVWDILHSNGPHPGLSDADETRIRMQLGTALARFLLKHFPANP